jgi:O-antigen ligase
VTAIRVGICALVAFTVLAHGAVEPWSEALLEIGAATLFALWGILALCQRQIEIRWTWLFPPLLCLGAFALLQQVSGLSAYPYATKIELLKWAAFLLLVFLTVESFRTTEELKRFVWFLVSLGFFVSLLAIIQYFTFNGKLYWFRVLHQGGLPFGPFVNHNHFAGFVELVVPLALALLLCGAVPPDKLLLVSLLTVVPISALVLSASRGGIISLLFEFALLGFLLRIPSKQLLKATGLGLVAGLLAAWLGAGWTVKRFESSTPRDVSWDRRVSMFRDTWQVFLHHPWAGSGLGTLETVFPRYESYYDRLVVDHAHNDYLELLADTGVIGGLCVLGFVAILFQRGLSNVRSAKNRVSRSFCAGAVVACAGLLLHSLVDFNMHIPSNALLFLLLAALATSCVSQPELANRDCRRS